MVELGFIIQEDYDHDCAELTGEMYGCVDADILYFLCFLKYAVSLKGLVLTQSKVYPCVFFQSLRKVNLKSW